MIWLVFIILSAAAVICVVYPLSRKLRTDPGQGLASAFYQAQLISIQADLASGLISQADALVAQAEAARRALAGASLESTGAPIQSASQKRLAALVVLVFVPALSLSLYARLGSPKLPDEPLLARLNDKSKNVDINSLVARLEAHLVKQPDDGKGFALIAPVYLRLDRTADAVRAFRKALELLGESSGRRADYAEALVAQAKGQVTPDALASFQQSLKADPQQPKSEYYIGLAAAQAGDSAKAISIFEQIVAQAPPDAPWVRVVDAKIAELRKHSGSPEPAPSGKTVAAVSAMPVAQQTALIHSMVEGLAARLAQNGNDVPGWLRLIRSLAVLKDADRANVALSDAHRALAQNKDGLDQVDALAQQLGLIKQ